jgi:hypothetical protein
MKTFSTAILLAGSLLIWDSAGASQEWTESTSVDVVIDTRKKFIKLINPEIQKNFFIDNLQAPAPLNYSVYKPVRSVSFAVSENVQFLIGNSRQPVQIWLVITLDERQESLTQIGIWKRKDFAGIVYQKRF